VLVVGMVAMLGMGIFQQPFFRWASDAAADVRDLRTRDIGSTRTTGTGSPERTNGPESTKVPDR
jgi:hypothetical protein